MFKLRALCAAALAAGLVEQPLTPPTWKGVLLQAANVGEGTLTVTVVDPAGAGIANAKATLSSGLTFLAAKPTATDGSVRFDGLPPGVYELAASAAGFGARQIQSIRVKPGATTEVGRIRLEVGLIGGCPAPAPRLPTFSFSPCEACTSALDGVVGRIWNVPTPGAAVTLRSAGGAVVACTVTGPEGKFTFLDLEPGLYTLTVSKAGHIDFVIDAATIHPGQQTRINEHLPLYPCPAGVQCNPMKKVEGEPVICL